MQMFPDSVMLVEKKTIVMEITIIVNPHCPKDPSTDD